MKNFLLLFTLIIISINTNVYSEQKKENVSLDIISLELKDKDPGIRQQAVKKYILLNRRIALKNINKIAPLINDNNSDVQLSTIVIVDELFLETTIKNPYIYSVNPYEPERLQIDELYLEAANIVLPELIKAINNTKDDITKTRIIYTLGIIGEPAKDTIPLMLNCLRNEKKFIKERTITTLAAIGVYSPEVLKELCRIIEDEKEDSLTKKKAQRSIEYIDPDNSFGKCMINK